MTMNAGALENKGIDIQASVIAIQDYERQIQWSISVNGAHNKNKIKKISNVLKVMNEENLKRKDAPVPIYEEGKSTTQLFTVRSLGIDPATGKEIFLKRNGEKTYIWDPIDKVSVGDTEPKFRGAISSSFTYKNLSVGLGFTYEWGGYRYNSTLVDKIENSSVAYNLDKRALTKRWSPENPNARYKSIEIVGQTTESSSRFVPKIQ